MATMAQVENILSNTKSGQFVVASCPGSKSDLNGYVVNLNQNDIQTVKIENWESGWPYEMYLYKVNYICNKEEEKTIKIKENFTTKVGIQVEKNGEKVELNTDNVTLKDNDITISADSVYNGYVTFPISTGDCGDDKAYTISCDKGYEVDKLLSSENAVTAGINKKIYVDITEDYLESISGKKIYPSDITCEFKIDGESAITHTIRPAFNYYTPGTTRVNVLWTVMEGVWFNWNTFQPKDYIVYPDDFVGYEPVKIGSDVASTKTGTGIYTVYTKKGEPFKQNFKLNVKSI